ncbi:unnamed protein product [Sphagnum tenellum]
MIFASRDNSSLIVGAADSFAELEAFYGRAVLDGTRLYKSEFQPSLSDMMLDERFEGFKKPPYVFEFGDPTDLDVFLSAYQISLISHYGLTDKHKAMIADMAIDPYLSPDADRRLIEELLGLDVSDPWDYRTEEQKKEDEEHRKEAEKAKKAGNLSGDSFGPSSKRKKKPKPGQVAVTDIRTSRNEDGTIEIDDVLAVKGVYDDNGKGAWLPTDAEVAAKEAAAKETEGVIIKVIDAEPGEQFYRFTMKNVDDVFDVALEILGELTEQADADKAIIQQDDKSFTIRGSRIANKLSAYFKFEKIRHKVDIVDVDETLVGSFKRNDAEAQHITPGGYIAIYHRVDVVGASLKEIVPAFAEQNLWTGTVAARGQMLDHAWIACATKLGAEQLAKALTTWAGDKITIEVYGVNDLGERLTPKGIEIIEENENIDLPRPWNDRAAEWDAMDKETKKEARITGKEFIFCGSYRGPGDGCIVYITPRAYYRETGEMWEGKLDLTGLPEDLKQVRPGIFQTKSRQWIPLCQDLVSRGMVESLSLQMHINTLD